MQYGVDDNVSVTADICGCEEESRQNGYGCIILRTFVAMQDIRCTCLSSPLKIARCGTFEYQFDPSRPLKVRTTRMRVYLFPQL